MKTIPRDVRVEIIQKSKSDDGNDLGLRLSLPEQLDKASKVSLIKILQKELLEVVEVPDSPSFIRVILEDFGFAVLEGITLPPEARAKTQMKELKEEENYHPLPWHTDKGRVNLPVFSALFSDVSGTDRKSSTVISHVDDIFPSLISSAGKMIEKLKNTNAPDELQETWSEARRKLELVLTSHARKQSNWDRLIHVVLFHLTTALRLSKKHNSLTKAENKAIISDSIKFAQTNGGRIYLHQWKTPQTLLISNQKGIIHCRMPAARGKEPGGILFAKAVL
jgi:hypothetical protein